MLDKSNRHNVELNKIARELLDKKIEVILEVGYGEVTVKIKNGAIYRIVTTEDIYINN